jgi:cysteinyl-tRNA synthetase
MSKSLKNFVSIREAFAAGHTATQIRFLFLIQEWDREINYQRKNTMVEVDVKIKAFTDFLRKV